MIHPYVINKTDELQDAVECTPKAQRYDDINNGGGTSFYSLYYEPSYGWGVAHCYTDYMDGIKFPTPEEAITYHELGCDDVN